MQTELKPFWSRLFAFDWKFGLFLLLIICIPRFFLVLNANSSGNYGYIGLVMLLSAIVPFLFLSSYGKRKIGLTKPEKPSWLLVAFVAGILASFFLYLLGESLYGNSYENWYIYIGKSYNIPKDISPDDKLILFLVMALTGMTFSPIGEELFFRGIVHASFANSFGDKVASAIDSSAFALTHISHFGLVFVNSQWRLLAAPTILWTASMFLVSVLFFICKKKSGSLLGAIVCHSAFNLGMIYCIFYLI
jgi:uncharacterized protein